MCGINFKVYPFEQYTRKYCKELCANKARKGKMPGNYQGLFFNCQVCNKRKSVNKYKLEHGEGVFCSQKCHYSSAKGISLSPATQFKKGENVAEKNFSWKGTKANYTAKHMWIRRWWGKANHCENKNCFYPKPKDKWGRTLKAPKRFDWANISGTYKRERNDWKQLCPSCHKLYDAGKLIL